MNAYCVRLSPKLIKWNMVDNYVTNIKGDA